MIWAVASFPLALFLAPFCRRLAAASGLIDVPRDNRFHAHPTPKLGGLVVMAAAVPAFAVSMSGPGAVPLAAGVSLAFLIGLIDDLRPLSPGLKLTGQLVAAGAAAIPLLVVAEPPGASAAWLSAMPRPLLAGLGVVWLVACQNAVNFIDNMDGIAAGLSALALGALAWHLGPAGPVVPALGVSLAAAGFLPHNITRPARLFLGDAGSLMLGQAVGFCALYLMVTAPTPGVLVAAPVAAALPLLDLAFVTVTRLRAGRSPAVGGRDHTTHRVFARTGSMAVTQRIFWGAGLILALASMLVRGLSGPVLVAALLAGALVLLGLLCYLATLSEPHRT